MRLTKRMREVLAVADLKTFEINEVPMGTMYGLEARGLVPSDWRKGLTGGVVQVTAGGSFPWFRKVKLTEAGMRAARTIQGYQTGLRGF